MRWSFPAAVVLLLALLAGPAPGDDAGRAGPAERFYFLGPHLFPYDQGISGLIAHDMDGDGRKDLLLLDVRASKFHLLLQGGGKGTPEADWEPESANDLEPDRLLTKDEVPVNETVLGHVVGDFAGDPAAIAYVTNSRELIVDRRDPDGDRHTAQRFLLELNSNFAGGFEAADLDANGKPDLVLLAEDALLIFSQDATGKLGAPSRHPVARERSGGLVLGDVDNDGRPDILYRAPGTRYPVRVRVTQPDGTPGPEFRFRMPPPRHMAVGDATGDGRNELALIESTTNRVKLLRWTEQKERPLAGTDTGALELVPFASDQKARMRTFALADVDGNGLPDVVVTDPAGARMALIRAEPGRGLMPTEDFPSLDEASDLVALPGPDGRAELVVCSAREGVLGLSRYDAETGRLEYPRPIEVPGEPHSVAAGRREGRPAIYCAMRAPDDEGGEEGPVELVALQRDESGYGLVARQVLEDLDEPPVHLLAVDVDADGDDDLIAFREYEPPLLLVQGEDGAFSDVTGRAGFRKQMLRDLKPASVRALPDPAEGGATMLLGAGSLVRAVRYDGQNLTVVDQFSSDNVRSSYAALAAADLDEDAGLEVLAADYTTHWLSVIERDEKGVYEVSRNVEIGPFELLGLVPADVDGDGAAEILIVGQEKLGVLFLSQGGPELEEVATYETDQEDTAYAQVEIGDLNGDGKRDLLLREVQQNQLEALYRTGEGEWRRGMRFRVFEARSLARREGPSAEPREMIIADVTGDGLSDIAIVVHDRLIVYPQQPPAPAE
jgi:hypothetical protein